MVLRKEILDNRIELYKLRIPNTSTIGICIGVKVGSIYEDENKRGISHFLEHMMFKTNKKYSYREICMGLELNGGISNAYTSTFLTFYCVETLPSSFSRVIDILFSMFENEKYDKKEFESEKKVVLSEIERSENDPTHLMERLIPRSVFGKTDYGDPVTGYRETISSISKEDIEEFKAKFYSSSNIFILIEGNFNRKHTETVKKYFSRLEEGKINKKVPSKLKKGEDIILKANTRNQIYYCRNFEINPRNIEFHVPFAFGEIISDGLSSLVFNVFREKYGIGYRIYFEPSYIYEDAIVLTLGIPGYEKDKDNFIDKAYKDLIEEINDIKNFEKYCRGRKRMIRLKYEKLRKNIFERLKIEPFILIIRNETLDELYYKILGTSSEKIINFVNNLGEYRIVKLFS